MSQAVDETMALFNDELCKRRIREAVAAERERCARLVENWTPAQLWTKHLAAEIRKSGPMEASARIAAAAPDLLAALQAIVTEIRAYQSPECDDEGAPGAAELKAADAAIAKAKGTQEPFER